MDLSIFDNLKAGIVFIDKNKKIKYINKTASLMFKKNVGDACFGLFSVCEDCPLEKHKAKPFRIDSFDVKVSCCSKKVCHSITSVYKEGEFVGVLEEFRDATEFINNLKDIEKQKEFTEVVLNSVVDAILVVNKKGELIHFNENAKKFICKDLENFIGNNIQTLIGRSLSDLPKEGVRKDITIETSELGEIKVSLIRNSLKRGEGEVISFYPVNECFSINNKNNDIISKNTQFLSTIKLAENVADTSASILIEGETGTGKSKLAKWIHSLSSRRNKPFVQINCAAIPSELLESELFGYVKGAFTGANKDKVGKVELAEGGTLFLDEIGDMPLYLQSKLLHLIQEKEFERLGDVKVRKADIRIISATNKNLKQLISKGLFREDLYYRLKVIHLHIPPLRERKEDIPYLINHFISKYSKFYKRNIKGISPNAVKLLLDYDFPGNIRELENIIERAVIIADDFYITEKDLPEEISNKHIFNPEETEKERIIKALKETNGNKTKAAKLLGMHRTTLWRKIKEYNIL